ncbi:NADPH-dependent FMN reductase [Ferrovum sp. PN-J185]|nr:NADPH-dependent FMN reductase [Ferrovum sp. PN-J185]
MDQLDNTLPNIYKDSFREINITDFSKIGSSSHKPKFLLLFGSLRDRSYSKFLIHEAARLLVKLGGEVKIFDPKGLPLPDGAPDTHEKVIELRELANWSEGMVWCSPERHGAMTGIMKA